MLNNKLMLGGVYILMAIMLVLGSLMHRREPAAKIITLALAWIAIFGAGFVLFHVRVGRDGSFRRGLRAVHLRRRFWLGRAAPQGRSGRHAGPARRRDPHSDGDRRPFLGRRGPARRTAALSS